MQNELKEFLKRWVIGTLAVLVAAKTLPGISYDHWSDLLVATLLLGILNSVLRPLLMLLSLPLLIVTLGLFTLVINASLLYLVHLLLPGFHVASFGKALLGALVISLVTLVLNTLTGTRQGKVFFHHRQRPPQRDPHDDGHGPVIDV
jgi:putative membrane protein